MRAWLITIFAALATTLVACGQAASAQSLPIIGQAEAAQRSAGANEIEFSGVVTAIATEAWTIDGRTVAVGPQTELKSVVKAGDQVKVHALVGDSGQLIAREVELAPLPTARPAQATPIVSATSVPTPAALPAAAAELEFTGTVQALGGTWTIDGRTVTITPQTEVKGAIKVGDHVEIHALVNADGTLSAREIELADTPLVGGGQTGNDDGANHDVNDDHGNDDGANHDVNDDGANHDINDDHGGQTGTDDGANHDVNDDHGGQTGNDDGANHDVNDDHGGQSGTDDGANHDVNDDHGGQSGNDSGNHSGGNDHGNDDHGGNHGGGKDN
jgi:hypothetical protein